jgi:putative nucleotidyltransferase with HDIG domain
VEFSTQAPEDLREVADLWLDGATPSQGDLRAATSLVGRLGAFEGVRPFSSVVQTLLQQLGRIDFDLKQVCEVIELDPALASRILRLANSAAYRGQGPCASVTQAVVRIGASNLSALAMAMSAMEMFRDLGGIGRKIRDHSAGTAVVARELAMSLRLAPVAPKVFLAGLLHDIGKLLVIQTGDKEYAELAARELVPSSMHLKEMALWGFDHAMLGAHVLRSWHIPAPIPQLIACQHQAKSERLKAPELARALDLLRVADVVDWLLGQGCPAQSPWVTRLAAGPDAIRAGLSAATLPALWDGLRSIRQEALHVFA